MSSYFEKAMEEINFLKNSGKKLSDKEIILINAISSLENISDEKKQVTGIEGKQEENANEPEFNRQDHLLYFLLRAHHNGSTRKSTFTGLFKKSKTPEPLDELFQIMQNNKEFKAENKKFFSSSTNLNDAFNISIASTAEHYERTRKHKFSSGKLSKQLAAELTQQPEAKSSFITKTHRFLRAKKTGNLRSWLTPYYKTYQQLQEKLIGIDFHHATSLRSEQLEKSIQKGFKEASAIHNYPFKGSADYNFKGAGLIVQTDQIAQQLAKKNGQHTMLDIGTADGGFVRDKNEKYSNIECFGITASDFRGIGKKDDPHYILGDAHELVNLFPETKFDCICSQLTFRYFSHVASALVQAYDRLKEGGILIIDHFKFKGCEKDLEKIIQYLQEKGYAVVGTVAENKINQFIIQKTKDKPNLDLPLIPQVDNQGNVSYKLIPSFKLEQEPRSESQYFAQGKEIIEYVLEKNSALKKIFDQSGSLSELLSDKDFKSLSEDARYLLIINMVAKTTDFSTLDNLIASVHNKGVYNPISTHPLDFTYIHILSFNPLFTKANREDQLTVLTIAALNDITNFGKNATNRKMLEHMGVPYNNLSPGYHHASPKDLHSDSDRYKLEQIELSPAPQLEQSFKR